MNSIKSSKASSVILNEDIYQCMFRAFSAYVCNFERSYLAASVKVLLNMPLICSFCCVCCDQREQKVCFGFTILN